jgi:hypothetical protein
VELLITASWVGYVVPYDSIPGRMSPLVTVILAMVNTLIKVVDMIPDSKKLTAVEVFITAALVQALIPMTEFAYILFRAKKLREKSSGIKDHDLEISRIATKTDNVFMLISPMINVFWFMIYILVFGLPHLTTS